ncbi:MAG TPA: DMT family transporter [Nitrososphaerales archaeon]|nr:DMT family transporter [Nitrososphaerales archaeon]
MKLSRDWILLSILLVGWGLNYPLVKIGLEYSTPLAFSFYRVVVAVSALLIILPLMKSKKPSASFRSVKTLIITFLFGATSIVFFLGFWFTGETLVDAGITAVIINTYPLFMVLFAKIFFSDKLTPLKTLGIIAGFVGTFLVVTGGNLATLSVDPFGFALLLAASISFASSSVIYRKWLIGFDRATLNTLQLFFSALMLLVWTLATNAGSLLTVQFTNPTFLVILLFTAVLNTSIAYVIWMLLLEKHGLVWLSSWIFFVPIIGLIGATLLLNESIGTIQLIGFAITISGIVLVNRKKSALKVLKTS